MRLCARSAEKVRIHRRKCAADALGGIVEGFESGYRAANALVGQVSDSAWSDGTAMRSGVSGLVSAADPVIAVSSSIEIGEGYLAELRGKKYRVVRVLRQPNYTFARLERIAGDI